MARLIQIFEHEQLTLNENRRGDKLFPRELERLYEFNDKNNNIYFINVRNGVKFTNYVGVIQIGGLTIEILPKADKSVITGKENYNKWRDVLLRMLATCYKIKIKSVSEASLHKRYYSILELYFELFLDELVILMRKGLVKNYHNQSSNTSALKGRIIFNKNIQQNFIHQERFFTTHQVYDYENLVNQILLKSLTILSKITTNSDIKDKIARIKLDFPKIKEIEITQIHFERVTESRKTIGYREVLLISKMIILNYSPDIKSGNENMLALLFDMNKLWEEYIYYMIKKSLPQNIEVNYQNSQRFWEHKTIRPDLVITKKEFGKIEKFIIDTKWKIIDANNPSDEDLKQMYVYNLYWDARKSMLLYPQTYETEEFFGQFYKGRNGDNYCKIGFVNILDNNGSLNDNIGEVILNKLLN